jgi:hypothetical protein
MTVAPAQEVHPPAADASQSGFFQPSRGRAMGQHVVKVVLTALVVVAVAELAKRGSAWSALLASLPLTSLLAFVWLYLDTRDTVRVAELSHGIFWMLLPSLVLLLALPALLRAGLGFWSSLAIAVASTAAAYAGLVWILDRAGLRT